MYILIAVINFLKIYSIKINESIIAAVFMLILEGDLYEYYES
jgi:hypothetical protein